MKPNRLVTWILLAVAVLSLPLCCLPVGLFPTLLFAGGFDVVNQSGETIHVTPIQESYGQRHVLLRYSSRFPYLPLFKRGDIRLHPGRSLHIACEVDEDSTFSEIAVRNARGEYRQLVIDQPTLNLAKAFHSESTFSIGPFQDLAPIFPQALEVAEQARRIYLGAWGFILPSLIPIGLFGIWLRRVLKLRDTEFDSVSEGEKTPQGLG